MFDLWDGLDFCLNGLLFDLFWGLRSLTFGQCVREGEGRCSGLGRFDLAKQGFECILFVRIRKQGIRRYFLRRGGFCGSVATFSRLYAGFSVLTGGKLKRCAVLHLDGTLCGM